MISDVLKDAEDRMNKTIHAHERDLATVRTGRASATLVDHVRADYYGTPTPLSQMASITSPDARMLVLQPWDKSALGAIEKAILKSDLGLTPTNDGSVIRLNFPQLTQDRRQELIKSVRKKVEEGKVALRNVRRDAHEEFRAMEKRKEISEDEQKRATEQLQKLVDAKIVAMEEVGKAKEAELAEV
jgi:ribosome recycling factor